MYQAGYYSSNNNKPSSSGYHPAYNQQKPHNNNGGVMIDEVFAPVLRPLANFSAQSDCERLKKAMKGAGTNEGELVQVICRRVWQERDAIKKMFKQMFRLDLEKEIADETSGHFGKVLECLLKTPTELAAFNLNEAMKGAGTDEDALVEIICTKNSQELVVISGKYKEMYRNSLEEDISGDTSGFLRRLLISLLTSSRPLDGPVDWNSVATDARSLYEAGTKNLDRFSAILSGRSNSHLRAVFDCYQREYKKDIAAVIQSELSGDVANALSAVIGVIRNRPGFFAARLQETMAGAGTNKDALLRIICSRVDFDLQAIKQEFQRSYGKTLASAVKDETSGDFQDALVTLID